jgi:hypothetical protein
VLVGLTWKLLVERLVSVQLFHRVHSFYEKPSSSWLSTFVSQFEGGEASMKFAASTWRKVSYNTEGFCSDQITQITWAAHVWEVIAPKRQQIEVGVSV